MATLSSFPTCKVCNRRALFACSRCQTAFYCGNACQRQDWRNHRSECTAAHQHNDILANDLSGLQIGESNDSVIDDPHMYVHIDVLAGSSSKVASRINSFMIRNDAFDPRRGYGFPSDLLEESKKNILKYRREAVGLKSSYYELWKVRRANFDSKAFGSIIKKLPLGTRVRLVEIIDNDHRINEYDGENNETPAKVRQNTTRTSLSRTTANTHQTLDTTEQTRVCLDHENMVIEWTCCGCNKKLCRECDHAECYECYGALCSNCYWNCAACEEIFCGTCKPQTICWSCTELESDGENDRNS